MIGVGVSLAHRGGCHSPSARLCRRALGGLAAATVSIASGKALALMQTGQILWNHSATLTVPQSSSRLAAGAMKHYRQRSAHVHAASFPVL